MLKLRALFVQLPSLPEVLINQARVRPEFPMPLSPRSRFLLSLACLALGILPFQAQINGAAPSVTSMGFGGTFLNGIRPSVTSLGPITYAVSEADDEDEEPETEPGLSSARVLNSKPGTRPSGYRDPAPVENNKVE